MSLSTETRERIASLIAQNDVIVFMKGNRMMPQCGFSGKTVQILDSLLPDYATVDVLEDPEIRSGIKEYSSWPTIPQLYIKGELIGGSDIVVELYSSGELHEKLGLARPERKEPTIHITDAAAQRIHEYMERNPGGELHLSVDARFQSGLGLSPRQAHEIAVQANGLTVLMDAVTAERADGVSIDLVETSSGTGFKIDNPNAPNQVKQIDAKTLKAMLDRGEPIHLFDVRTPEERAIAKIVGARLLDQGVAAEIEKLPKDTPLFFHCHHGGRSQAAAEHFRDRGFTNTHNLVGGIDAWSIEVDPSIPRY
jgi:monothiol glutaredoxin